MSLMLRLRHICVRALLAGFLLLALFLGGASLEGEVHKSYLFLVSALVLLAAFLLARAWWRGGAVTVLCFCLMIIGLCVFQLVGLPDDFWSSLPMRQMARQSQAVLGGPEPWHAISLAPEASLAAFLAFLVPAAGFVMVAAIKWQRGAVFLCRFIPLLGAADAVLGLLQVLIPDTDWLYFYAFTNRGSPVGVFANANHQASFLLMCLPFVAVLGSELRREWSGSDAETALAILVSVFGLLILAGIFAAGSAAGYLLLVPVVVLSVLLFSGASYGRRGRITLGIVLVASIIAFAALVVFTSPRLSGLGVTSFDDAPTSRIGISRVATGIVSEHWRFGTGLGTFEDVFGVYEDASSVSRTYVAHAHNDYLEWLIETGLAGGVLLGLVLVWFVFHFLRVWTFSRQAGLTLRRAAAIACLVPVLHSLVDYPLRTPAIASLAGMCAAIMVVPHRRREAIAPRMEGAAPAEEPVRSVTI
jgi:O-antigen ligase